MIPASMGTALAWFRAILIRAAALVVILVAGTVVTFAGASVNYSGTIVEMRKPSVPGAVAEVSMKNVQLNSSADNWCEVLTFEQITAEVCFEWNTQGNDDRIYVTPVGAYQAIPEFLDVPENTEGVIQIFPLLG